MEFTARIEKSADGWYVGQVEEVPAAISQGKTIDELKANLIDALQLIFQVNREFSVWVQGFELCCCFLFNILLDKLKGGRF